MPIYTFRCKCGYEDDILTDSSDTDLRMCSKCRCGMKRTFSKGSSFKLKGGGWYKDGYDKPK
jgi:putative FmdB family regulatory protein